MKLEIKNRWTGAVQYRCDLSAEMAGKSAGLQLGFGVKLAHESGADLRGANLSYADMRGANLIDADMRYADLSGADLRGANLSGADMRYANLSDADMRYANLSDADMRDANLSDADMRYADLSDADMRYADLSDADLSDADLSDANLSGANLRTYMADLWVTLAQNPHEVPAIVEALRCGRVDGSTYQGACACLVGTIANARGVSYADIDHNARAPAERWFAMIELGDKPGDDTGGGFASKMALEWTLEWCALNGVEIAPEVSA